MHRMHRLSRQNATFSETWPSGGSYLLGTSLVTPYNWKTIDIKNRAHRNLPKSWKFMHATLRRTPPSPPRHFLSTPDHVALDRQTPSRHRHSVGPCPQRLSAGIRYPFRKAYRAFVHTSQTAQNPHQNPHNFLPPKAIMFPPSASSERMLYLPFAEGITGIYTRVQKLSLF
jgi:hypothetical protein